MLYVLLSHLYIIDAPHSPKVSAHPKTKQFKCILVFGIRIYISQTVTPSVGKGTHAVHVHARYMSVHVCPELLLFVVALNIFRCENIYVWTSLHVEFIGWFYLPTNPLPTNESHICVMSSISP